MNIGDLGVGYIAQSTNTEAIYPASVLLTRSSGSVLSSIQKPPYLYATRLYAQCVLLHVRNPRKLMLKFAKVIAKQGAAQQVVVR